MNKHIVLNIAEKKGSFTGAYEITKTDQNITFATVKNKPRAIKKFIQLLGDEVVIITKNSEDKKALKNNLLLCDNVPFDYIIPLISKSMIQAIKHHNFKLPLKEIYISASPEIAYLVIKEIYDVSRLFTVINSTRNDKTLFDELYFKYGIIVRQREKVAFDCVEDTALIRYDYLSAPKFYNSPIIDISDPYKDNENIISLKDISVYDKQIENVKNVWGGVTGINMYSLLGIMPDKDAQVNINKKSDEIFRLDIAGF